MSNGFVAPITNWRSNVSSGFGPRRAPRTAGGRRGSSNHKGIDIAVPAGTPIKAAKGGQVVFAGKAGGYGNLAVIRHNDGTYTKYGHAQSLNVRPGQQVQAGEQIGKVGSTGNSSGPHLHFEVRQGDWRNGKALDPAKVLNGAPDTASPVPGAQQAQQQQQQQPAEATPGEQPAGRARQATPQQRARRRKRAGKGARRGAGKGGAPRKGGRRRSQMRMPQQAAQQPGQTPQTAGAQQPQRPGATQAPGTPPTGGQTTPQALGDAQQPQQQTPDAASGQGFTALREKLARQGVTGEFIKQMAQKYNVPEDMILGVIQQESGGNPNARSSAGARGLMQLMPATARGLGVKNSYDPKQNVEGGVKYLGQMLRMFNGNQQLALAAYNAGPGNVRKYGGIPPFRETQKYVKVIQQNRQQQTQYA